MTKRSFYKKAQSLRRQLGVAGRQPRKRRKRRKWRKRADRNRARAIAIRRTMEFLRRKR